MLDIEFRRINQPRTERVFHRFMRSIDAQFAENILAMGRDSMDAGEALSGNLLRGLTLSDCPHDLRLCLRQDIGLLFFLLLGDDELEGTLTEVAAVVAYSFQGLLHLTQGAVLEHHAELM